MIDLSRIAQHRLQSQPYAWAMVDGLFSPPDAEALAATYPCDHFMTVAAYGGEKDYEYEARNLIGMGADAVSYPEELSESWLALARDLFSPAYRRAMSSLTEMDLTTAPVEVNVFHYGPGASLGAHLDLPDKLVTHVLYFNRSWDVKDGGCLSILRSADPADIVAEIPPVVGNSAVLVRSEKSWHAVSRVVNGCPSSRRSVTVTFYRAGSASSMWPPGHAMPLHRYDVADLEAGRPRSAWARWRRRLASWG
jgi:SM-20-related protein